MVVGVIQSNYIPWRGYFDFIASCDLFVFYDDVQYTKQDWRNRNRIRTETGTEWITVPVKHDRVDMRIDEIETVGEWRPDHERRLKHHLRDAFYLQDALELWRSSSSRFLSEMNRAIILRICEYLRIRTPTLCARELKLTGSKTDRLIQLMKRVGGKTYLSGPAAKAYLDVEKMNEAGFGVEWKTYGPYPEYKQQYPGFDPAVTMLDLLAHKGTAARWLM